MFLGTTVDRKGFHGWGVAALAKGWLEAAAAEGGVARDGLGIPLGIERTVCPVNLIRGGLGIVWESDVEELMSRLCEAL